MVQPAPSAQATACERESVEPPSPEPSPVPDAPGLLPGQATDCPFTVQNTPPLFVVQPELLELPLPPEPLPEPEPEPLPEVGVDEATSGER